MDVLVGHPWRIVMVAVFFVLAALLSGRRGDGPLGKAARPCFLVAMLWGIYAIWEYVVGRGQADIRVDLLLIYPALLITSVLAPIISLRRAQSYRSSEEK